MEVPESLRRGVEKDPTLVLTLAAEACVSPRSVQRLLTGTRVRTNTIVAVTRAWERVVTQRRAA